MTKCRSIVFLTLVFVLAILTILLTPASLAYSLVTTPTPSPTPVPGSNGQIIYRSETALVSINADGTKKQALTDPTNGLYLCPALSPNGNQLAVAGAITGFELYSLGTSGGTPRTLIKKDDKTIDAPVTSLAWSPDGKQIAYVSQSTGQLSIIGNDGKPVRSLNTLHFLNTDWSKTGQLVAFARDSNNKTGLYLLDPAGNSSALLVPLPDSDWTASLASSHLYTHDVVWPHWSPDGKQIAYASAQDGAWAVYVVDASNGTPRRITDDPGPNYAPAWSPDGAFLVFVSERDGETALYITHLSDGYTRRLTGLRTGGCPVWKATTKR